MKLKIFLTLCVAFAVSTHFCCRVRAEAALAPQIRNFTPSQGIPGTAVVIEGVNLAGATSVKFNGAEASFSILADLLTAIVPVNAASGPITIVTPGGTATSTANFEVLKQDPPSVTSFTPAEGEAGAAVQIAGANLVNVTSVKFNGVEASFSLVTGTLIATVPPSATSGPITVTTAGGAAVSATPFTVVQRAGPVVTGFTPTSGPPGWSVEIQGQNLVNVTTVQFNGVNASFLPVGGTLRATVPANATTGPITVTTLSGSSTSAQSFTVTLGPPPTISDFSPATGEPGTAVEIRGTFLRDVISVKFNGVEAAFTNSLFRPLSAVVPLAATTGPITVATRAGTVSSAQPFTVVNPKAPEISQFSPESGGPGALIQIFGTNLANVVSVEFNGVKAEFLEFNTERMLAFVPISATSGPIKVTTQFGVVVSAQSFTVPPLHSDPGPVTLAIQSAGSNRIQLSWNLNTGMRLETAESVGAGAQWTASSLKPVEEQGRNVLVIELEGKTRFYRLARP